MAKKKKKQGEGGKKNKKGNEKPEWMSEEVYAISTNLTELKNHLNDEADPKITDKEMAAYLLWILLIPEDSKTIAKREEIIKLEIIEILMKILNDENINEKLCNSCIGILSILIKNENGREIIINSKLSILTIVKKLFVNGSMDIIVNTCKILRILLTNENTKYKVLSNFQEWDFLPLIKALYLRKEMHKFEGITATTDATISIEQFCKLDEFILDENKNQAKTYIHNISHSLIYIYPTIKALIELCLGKCQIFSKKAAIMSMLLLLRGSENDTVKEQFIRYGGIKAMLNSLKDYFLDMETKALALGCIYKSIIPNILNKQKSEEEIDNEILDSNVVDDININIEDEMTDDEIKLAVMNSLDLILKENVLIKKLIELSCDESGPLLPLNNTIKNKSKKGKGEKKEKGKIEAQAYATACLRLLSMSEEGRCKIVENGGIRYLAPLLECNINEIRWNARHVLISLSVKHEHMVEMTAYKVPDYVTGANLPQNVKMMQYKNDLTENVIT